MSVPYRSCLPFRRINPIASAVPAPGLASSPPNRSRRAPRSSVILGRCWIPGRRKTTRSRTNICSSSTAAGPSTARCARTSPATSITPASRTRNPTSIRASARSFIRAIKNIEPGEEINYDYGTDYFKAYLKPIGCKCDACEKKRKKKRAEARAERLRLKAKAEKRALKKAEKESGKSQSKAPAKNSQRQQECRDKRREINEWQALERRMATAGPSGQQQIGRRQENFREVQNFRQDFPEIGEFRDGRGVGSASRSLGRQRVVAASPSDILQFAEGAHHNRLPTKASPREFGVTVPLNNSAMLAMAHAALPAITMTTSAFGIAWRVPSQPTSAV